jgi:uncharacterized protein YabE (DUF348 family)
MARVAVRPLALGLAVVALTGGHTAWEASAASVVVTVDGHRQVVRTHGSTVKDALEAAGLKIGSHDLLAPAQDVKLTEETAVVVRRGRLMQLTVDGAQREVWVTAMSVAEALGQIGVRAEGAVLSADRSRSIPLKGFSLDVRTRKSVQLLDGGKARRVVSHGVTVGELLGEQRVTLRTADRLVPASGAALKDGMVVRVTRVSGRNVVETVPISFSVKRRADSSMYEGETRTLRAGRVGALRKTFAVTYVDGHLSHKKLVSSVRTAEPVAKIVAYGTKDYPYYVAGTGHLNWRALARCESGGNPRATGGNGTYRGLYQFTFSAWRGVGGHGDPIDASSEEQTYRAKLLFKRRGAGPWPHCGKYLYS